MTIPIKFRRGLKTNLPSTASAGEPLFTEDTHEMFIGTGDGIVPVSDPALKRRVDKLEQSRSTVAKTYIEDFLTTKRVDAEKTTAVVGVGNLRTGKSASFDEDFSTSDYFDSDNSFGVALDTAKNRVKLKDGFTLGSFRSTAIPAAGVEKITMKHQAITQSALGVQSKVRVVDDMTGSYYQPLGLVDRAGRDWVVSFIVSKGYHVSVRNADGTLVFSKVVFNLTATMPSSGNMSHSIAVDYNNRVWITAVDSNSSTRSVYIGVVNPDGTVFMPLTTTLSGTSTFPSNATVVDTNGRIWSMICGSTSTATRFIVFNPDGTTYIPLTTLKFSGALSFLTALMDRERNIILVVTSSGGNVYLTKIGLDGVVIGAASGQQLNISGLTHQNMDAFIDMDSGSLVTFCSTSTGLYFYKTNIDKPASSSPTAYSGSFTALRGSADVYNDNGVVRVVYVHPTTTRLTHLAFDVSRFTLIEPETVMQEGLRPSIGRDSSGKLQVLFDTTEYDNNFYQVKKVVFDSVNTTVSFTASNDRGISWIEVPDGVEVSFPTRGDSVTLCVEFTAPNGSVSSELIGYGFATGSSGFSLTQEFVSSVLPSVSPISDVTLTAEQTLNGGSVDWFVTNNGGWDWIPVTLGEQLSFPNPINADLRVKAVLTAPFESKGSPVITSYSIVSSNMLLNPDIADPMLPQRVVDLEINLLKTNFKLITYMNAPKYGLKNMLVDTFTDLSGVDIAKSQAGYDHEQKKFTTGIVDIVPLMTANNAPAPFVAAADLVTYGAAFMLFDRSTSTYWGSNTNDPHWISIYLGGAEQTIDRYLLSGVSKYSPTSWLLEASNNGSAWDTLHSVSGYVWTNYEDNEFTIPTPNIKPYKYYRIYITASQYGRGVTQISELRLQRAVDQNFLISKPEITTAPPSKIVIVGDEVVAGGKIEYHASRDGGNTWTVAPAETLTDISSQPAGTELVVKATIHGNAELNAWGYYYE
ncbi:discoidin domain-containing protein [Brevibacillus reuszeri]|uniref:discoidin domain-containing protein n=1 Tax=Brevibacillus reuszeri TaxID=54915 RepID=UPI002898029B|nr:discoidin domain-containing protein [Brevibacillus reuszeri]